MFLLGSFCNLLIYRTQVLNGQKGESSQKIWISEWGKSSQLRQGAQSSTQQAFTESSQTSANVRNPRQIGIKTSAGGKNND